MAQAWKRHLGERNAYEGPQQERRMGNAKARFHECGRAVEKQVDVDGSRGLGCARRADPPLDTFDLQTRFKECLRGEIGFKPHRRVEILRLAGTALG